MKIKTTDYRKIPPEKVAAVAPVVSYNRIIPSASAAYGLAALPFTPPQPDPDEENCPFRRLIIEWLDYCRQDDRSPKTIDDYRDKAFKFWWWWSDFTHYAEKIGPGPEHVTVREAREFAAYLRQPLASRWGLPVPKAHEKLSDASVASYGRTVKVFFNWLEREQYIARSPFNKSVHFSNRHKQDRIIKTVEPDELACLFQLLTDPERVETFAGCRDLAIICLMLDSGIRLGELLSIRVCDLDLEHNRCQVEGKTGKRVAVFSETCRTAIARYLQHSRYPVRSVERSRDTSPVWLTADGLPLSYYGCESIIRRLRRDSGVDFHAHKLRHTFATTMAAQGVNIFDLKGLMGHTSILTTQIYVEQNVNRLAEIHRPHSPLTAFVAVSQQVKRPRGRPRRTS